MNGEYKGWEFTVIQEPDGWSATIYPPDDTHAMASWYGAPSEADAILTAQQAIEALA